MVKSAELSMALPFASGSDVTTMEISLTHGLTISWMVCVFGQDCGVIDET